MSNRGTTSIGLWVEFQAAVLRQLPRPEEAESTVFEGWLQNQEFLKGILAGALLPPADILPPLNYQKAYELLGMSEDYKEFVKTNSVKGDPNLWTVPVLKGVTCNKVVAALRKLGVDVDTYTEDLDKDVPTNDRDPNKDGSYTVSFARTVEADEANRNLSANTLKERNHKGITLLERLLLELGYFLATGKHLDEKNWTLCSGSRFRDGDVPDVYWRSGRRKVVVSWYGPDGCFDFLRSRSVVVSFAGEALPSQ